MRSAFTHTHTHTHTHTPQCLVTKNKYINLRGSNPLSPLCMSVLFFYLSLKCFKKWLLFRIFWRGEKTMKNRELCSHLPVGTFISVCRCKVSLWHAKKFHSILLAIHSLYNRRGWRGLCLHAPSLQIFFQNAHGMCHLLMFGSRR